MTPELQNLLLQTYMQTMWRHFRSRKALLDWQENQVRAHLMGVVPKSRALQRRFAGRPVADWRELEPIDKSVMMATFTDLNTVGLTLDEAMEAALKAETTRDFSPEINGVTVGLSSGTSGHRGLFVVPPEERAAWAGHMLARMLPHPLVWPRRDRVAFFLRANSTLYETTASTRVRFEYFDLIEDLDDQVPRLQDLDPTILVAPPSTLRRLAKRLLDGRIRLAPIKVISVAEVLDPIDERFLRQTFGQTIHQVYQATEGFLGSTCEYGTLHLAEDVVAVERERLDDVHFRPILTDFRRSAQPIVRYRLNDVLRLRPVPCSCGSVLQPLASIGGRDDDIFVGRRGASEVPVFADFLRRAVLTAHDGIADYGLRQLAPDQVAIWFEPATSASDDPEAIRAAIEHALTGLFERLGCQAPAYLALDDWPEGGMTKRKRVERAFDWQPE
jgi:putative adenylate-forming enzyme